MPRRADGVSAMAIDGKDLYYVLTPVRAGLSRPRPCRGRRGDARLHLRGDANADCRGAAFETPAFTPTSVLLGEMGVGASAGEVDIVSVPRDGSAPAILGNVATSQLFTPPVTDGTSVYFADGNGVESVPLTPAASPAVPTRLSTEYPSSLGVFGQTCSC